MKLEIRMEGVAQVMLIKNYIKGNASLTSFGDAGVGVSFRVGYYRNGDLEILVWV
jgi:hypothetical protein